MKGYDHTDALSIFRYSGELLRNSLSSILPQVNPNIDISILEQEGKGGLGILVEKYFFGYEPNSSPLPDFPEAGVELKVTPLKKIKNDQLAIKERLVCDMIDYMALVDEEFENSRFYKKSILMLIIFYLHLKGVQKKDLSFIYSILWKIKDKDLEIIRQDFLTIREKVRKGLAHELSEGDTIYLGACRKGQKNQSPRKQPFSDIYASARAFSLKTSYMRSILDFVESSGKDMATNLNEYEMPGIELVSNEELKKKSFEEIVSGKFQPFIGLDYKQIASILGLTISPNEKSKYAHIVKEILNKGLKNFDDIEEFKKAGIKVKTIRIEKNGHVKEHMSFPVIDYQEFADTDDWIDSTWYEIITTRYLFVIFRESPDGSWGDEKRYVLDKMFFWTMPTEDFKEAEEFWSNIKENVARNTLQDDNNTFWRVKDRKHFHVRPKAINSQDKTFSPQGEEVPKKCYWFDSRYLMKEIKNIYGEEWPKIFKTNQNAEK